MSPDDPLHTERDPAPLSAEDEAEVARLLADAAEPVRMPPEVVDRLESVLADLVAERPAPAGASEEPPVEPPVELAARRPRWPRLMLAAAAVVIGGYGVTAALQPGGMSGDDGGGMSTADESVAGSGESSALEDTGGGADARAQENRTPGNGRATAGSLQEPDAPRLLVLGPVLLRPDRLQEDVQRMLDGSPRTGGPATSDSAECAPPALADDESWVPSRYDGRRSVLVTDSGAGGAVDASVFSCTGELLASVTVDAP
jgi:hypothetical protein